MAWHGIMTLHVTGDQIILWQKSSIVLQGWAGGWWVPVVLLVVSNPNAIGHAILDNIQHNITCIIILCCNDIEIWSEWASEWSEWASEWSEWASSFENTYGTVQYVVRLIIVCFVRYVESNKNPKSEVCMSTRVRVVYLPIQRWSSTSPGPLFLDPSWQIIYCSNLCLKEGMWWYGMVWYDIMIWLDMEHKISDCE